MKLTHKERCKLYYKNNREKVLARVKAYYEARDKQERASKDKEYFIKNKTKIQARMRRYRNELLKTNINYKLSQNLRARFSTALKKNRKITSAVKDLGCSLETFKNYLESKFKPGMSWDNWSRTGWHIDHIKPLASFDLTDVEQAKQACHYTNLQPLWASDNKKKGARV